MILAIAKARSCFDKLSTNGDFLVVSPLAVRPEPVEGRTL